MCSSAIFRATGEMRTRSPGALGFSGAEEVRPCAAADAKLSPACAAAWPASEE